MKSPALVASFALLLIPLALIFERAEFKTWNARLIIPSFEDEPNRHTPIQTNGVFLPPRITKNTTLTPDQNPIILAGRTEIPAGVTLSVSPGVHIYAHEFSEISTSGTLRMQGAEQNPIQLTSNEMHPQNQLWNGIIVQSGGHAEISHTIFHHASPALTCLKDSTVSFTNNEIHEALIGIFTESPACTFTNNRVQAIREKYVRTF